MCVCVPCLRLVAVMAQNRSTSPHVAERVSAGHLGKVSYWMSISGIILGTVLLIVFIIIGVVLAQSQPPSVQCSVKGGHYDHYTKQCRMWLRDITASCVELKCLRTTVDSSVNCTLVLSSFCWPHRSDRIINFWHLFRFNKFKIVHQFSNNYAKHLVRYEKLIIVLMKVCH